jgi:hypothetical protein
MFVILIGFVSGYAEFSENCVGDCWECGCREGYVCEAESRSCVLQEECEEKLFEVEQGECVEADIFSAIIEPFEKEELIDMSKLFLNNRFVLNLADIQLIFGLDPIGKPIVDVNVTEDNFTLNGREVKLGV